MMAVACSLSACAAVGPDYRVPAQAIINVAAARAPFADAEGVSAVSADAPSDAWWSLYDDPKLDALVQRALSANTDLRVADANLERAHALLAEVKAAGRPNVTLGLDVAYAQLSAQQYLVPAMIPATGLYDAGLSVSYQVDLFGGIRRGVEAARADEEAVEAARDLARVNIAAEVTRAYVEVCATGAELKVARRSLELQQKSLALTQRLVDAGRGASLDVTHSQAQVEQLRANVPGLLTRQRNGVLRIAVLTGRPPAAFDPGLERCSVAPRLARPIPVGDGAALLRRRPDVRRAERRLAASTAMIGVRIAALYPTVRIGASIGSTGAVPSAFSDLTDRYALGPGVVWRADHSADRARIGQARAEAKADLARFDGAVLTALRETESALNVYGHDLERQADLRAAENRAAKAAVDARRLQAAGRSNSLTTLDAERTLASVEAALAASQTQVAADQIGLFLALGGGWGQPPPPEG
jgi:NodT family efflux transporter outer membrane factor (OMF) lipoprotein